MTDAIWSRKVKEKYGKHCHWIPCFNVSLPIEAAHIIGRWNPSERHNIDNGIPLCSRHHRLFDSLNPSKREAILELWKGGAQLAEVEDPDQTLDADEVFSDDQEFIDSLDEMLEEIEEEDQS